MEVRGAMLAASCLLPRTGLVTTVGSALMLLLMRLLSAMSFSITCTILRTIAHNRLLCTLTALPAAGMEVLVVRLLLACNREGI